MPPFAHLCVNVPRHNLCVIEHNSHSSISPCSHSLPFYCYHSPKTESPRPPWNSLTYESSTYNTFSHPFSKFSRIYFQHSSGILLSLCPISAPFLLRSWCPSSGPVPASLTACANTTPGLTPQDSVGVGVGGRLSDTMECDYIMSFLWKVH